jgi:serine/threonine-protein kinase
MINDRSPALHPPSLGGVGRTRANPHYISTTMSLTPGTRLGPYEVAALIGAGGMGEVYLATDTTLKRQVAIKVLPGAVAADPERLARFQREAEVLASLNHPNIASIYGVERSGAAPALVMELVDGPTLADRIAAGAIAPDQALRIAKSIAEALAAAHERGVIHRDLKPSNIKVRPDGTVKLLDFGLAKAVDAGIGSGKGQSTRAPTLTAAVPLTGRGIVMGTAAYMSPEQALGEPVDRRADIWALGCVMYEMLTGRSAFPGDSGPRILAKVLETEPDFSALPATTPLLVRRLIRRCLEKDPRRRLHDAADAALEIDEALAGGATDPTAISSSVRPAPRAILPWILGALGGGIAGTLAFSTLLKPAAPEPASIVRTIVSVMPAAPTPGGGLAVSPDGLRVVYEAGGVLHMRTLDQLESQPLRGSEGARWPAFSRDGHSIAFFVPSESVIKRMAIAGGSATSIATIDGGDPRGLSWGPDDEIVFATTGSDGLWRVRAVGGKPERLTRVVAAEAISHDWPSVLPDGAGILFTAFRGASSRVAVLSLETSQVTYLVESGTHPQYAPSGHLLYETQGRLWAVGFDAGRRVVTSDNAVPVVDDVLAQHVALTSDGSLVYVTRGSEGAVRRILTWVERNGSEKPLPLPTRAYGSARVSPDGRRIVASIRDAGPLPEMWVSDLDRPAWSRIATPEHDGGDWFPLWTPDGRRLVFGIYGASAPGLFRTLADGTGKVESVLTIPDNSFIDPRTWTPDGKSLLFSYGDPNEPRTGLVNMDPRDAAARSFRKLIERDGGAWPGGVSPDGRWIVTESVDSGVSGIYIERFPELGDRHRVSGESGGRNPVWSPNGRELFYRSHKDGAMMAVAIQTAPTLSIGIPIVLFAHKDDLIQNSRAWDVSPNGRFLLLKRDTSAAGNTSRELVLVQNWFEELKRLAP